MPLVLSTARGRRQRAVLKTEGTVFPNTDRPRPANNVFIFFPNLIFKNDSRKSLNSRRAYSLSRSAGEAIQASHGKSEE